MLIRSRRASVGLGRTVLTIEYPGIWGGLIDLQSNGDRTPNIDSLAAELLHPDGETQIAISADGQRNVPRFVKQSLAELPAQLPPVRVGTLPILSPVVWECWGAVSPRWLIRQRCETPCPDRSKREFRSSTRTAQRSRIVTAQQSMS